MTWEVPTRTEQRSLLTDQPIQGPAESIPISIRDSVAAAACTIPILADRSSVMVTRAVLVCMTGRTIRCVCRESPGYRLIIAGMAIVTAQIGSVVTRVVAGDMSIGRRGQPPGGRMAVVTLLGGDKVAGWLAGCRAAIMATGTVTRHIVMIKARRYPGIGCVAIGADIATGDMLWMLAGCRGAVVATRAGTLHLRVIHT